MFIHKTRILKFLYNTVFTGLPLMTYNNPINKVPIHAPMRVNAGSTYINFKLDDYQTKCLTEYIHEYNNTIDIIPIKISEDDTLSNYISVNIYNCSSPLFITDEPITRCEINTYVQDKYKNKGTLIIDYLCNDLSMDPVNIFKQKSPNVHFKDKNIYTYIDCSSEKDLIQLNLNFTKFRDTIFKISDNLVDFSDKIFYKNGILDKLYYDTSLTRALTMKPVYVYNLTFVYRNLTFKSIDSVFYFSSNIDFVGSIWHNLENCI